MFVRDCLAYVCAWLSSIYAEIVVGWWWARNSHFNGSMFVIVWAELFVCLSLGGGGEGGWGVFVWGVCVFVCLRCTLCAFVWWRSLDSHNEWSWWIPRHGWLQSLNKPMLAKTKQMKQKTSTVDLICKMFNVLALNRSNFYVFFFCILSIFVVASANSLSGLTCPS